MGARKGQNNFKNYQIKATESRKLLISNVLRGIRKGTAFTDTNSLIVYVAERVNIHRTNLRRNPEYQSLILDYFGSQIGAVGLISEDDASEATLRAKYLAEKIKASNLQTENSRLKSAIQRSQNNSPSQGINSPQDLISVSSNTRNPPSDLAFANTAMTLLVLLERLYEKGIGITVEPDKMLIVDGTETGNKKIIAGPDRTKWFFNLLSTHPLLRNSAIRSVINNSRKAR
jgi:hypothetical protein